MYRGRSGRKVGKLYITRLVADEGNDVGVRRMTKEVVGEEAEP